jgi:hypothetical protein
VLHRHQNIVNSGPLNAIGFGIDRDWKGQQIPLSWSEKNRKSIEPEMSTIFDAQMEGIFTTSIVCEASPLT